MQLGENKSRFVALTSIVFFVSLARIITPPFLWHQSAFTPVDAIALFSGAYFCRNRLMPFLVTLLSIWVSDILIGRIYLGQWMLFYQGFYWQYGSFLLITLIGMMLKDRVTPFNVAAAGLSSAILFFAISNFGVWMTGLLYQATKEGLVQCYIAGIPFFKRELLSNAFYCTLLFGSFEWMQRRFLSLRLKPSLMT